MTMATEGRTRTGPPGFWDGIDRARRLAALAGIDHGGATVSVAHIGSEDGVVSIGLLVAGARAVVGFDEEPTDPTAPFQLAEEAGVAVDPAAELRFLPIHAGGLPAESAIVDAVVVTGLHRLRATIRLMDESVRLLRPGGVCVVDARPLFHGPGGALLLEGAAGPFDHLLLDPDSIGRQVHERVSAKPYADALLDRYHRLSRLTAVQIQQAVLASGLDIRSFELDTVAVQPPPALQHLPMHDIVATGLTLTAVRA